MVRHYRPESSTIMGPNITSTNIILILYADDGATCFNTWQDMVVGVSLIEEQMVRFGLIMHAGHGKKPHKTKYLFIPLISETKRIIEEHLGNIGTITHTTTQLENGYIVSKPKIFGSKQKQQFLLDLYPSLRETIPFHTKTGGLIISTPEFIYLGSVIYYSLRGTPDVELPILKANQVMGALRFL